MFVLLLLKNREELRGVPMGGRGARVSGSKHYWGVKLCN